jgi:nucleotide-binding universal stress UspA family protein
MTSNIARSTVLVAVDGSPDSRVALRWAHGYASRHGLELAAAQTWEYPAFASLLRLSPLPSPDEVDDAVAEALAAIVDEELGEAGRSVRLLSVHGPAGTALVATGADAALLVVGREGREGVSGWLGSVSRRVLEQASCPVAVVPPEWEPGDGDDIVVGVDFSDAARAPLRWAAREAQTTGKRMVVLHALPPVDVRVDPATAKAEAEQQIRDRCEAFGHDGVRCAALIDERVPPAAVEAAAASATTDLVVLGRRGASRLDKLLLGSVAGYAARYAVRPVVVVPPDWHA